MKSLRLCLLVSLGAAAFGASGCRSVDTVQRAEPKASPNAVDAERVSTDSRLKKALEVVSVRERETSSGFPQVQVELRSRVDGARRFNYRFAWFDADGFRLREAGASWTPRQIEGGEAIALASTAPSKDAVDFRLKIVARQ